MYDPIAIMTDRLIIKEADSTDLDTLTNLWTNPEIARYPLAPSGRIAGRGDIQEWWRKYQMRRTEGPWERQFVIQIKDGPFIGESGWTRLDDPNQIPGFSIGPRLITVITDIRIDPAYSDLGYESETLNELLWWAFDTAGVDIILAGSHRENRPAKKIYEECGFVDTGALAWNDFHIHALKKDEWG
jgi:RimJ/RimL family protein N-acetyltransferase